MTELVAVTGEDCAGAVSHEGRMFSAWLKGTADYAALDAIDLLLTRAHAEAVRLEAAELTLDLTRLEFMNSSCFKCFLTWISDIQDLPAGRQYRVKLLSNPRLHWQKRSLHTLRCFAVELITIVEH